MNRKITIRYVKFVCLLLICSCASGERAPESNEAESLDSWTYGPFVKENAHNPILKPEPELFFICPIRREKVNWEEKDVFNPAAVVKGSRVYLIYRAEDHVGKNAGTSRIGIAESTDGINFKKLPQPVLFPSNDFMKKYEWEGGIEDPRIVEDEGGNYIMTYTAYDGEIARLCIATSPDLFHWEKKGPAFSKAFNGKYVDTWSKSGAIICRRNGSKLLAEKINGKYWMYWGDVNMNIAVSDNLVDWEPIENGEGKLFAVFKPRPGMFDSRLVEPGPPPVLTEEGVLFIYNSMNLDEGGGDPDLAPGTYTSAQVLLDKNDPKKVLKRATQYFLSPDQAYEKTGQVNNVVFSEGLVYFKDAWFLYYGTADSKIALATYRP